MSLKKVIIAAVLAVALFAFSLAFANWLVNSHRFQVWLVDQLNQRISGRMEVDGMDLSVLRGRFRLSGVRLLGVDDAVLATVRHCELSVAWASLMRRELVFRRLLVDGVALEIISDDENRLSITTALTGPTPQQEASRKKTSSWQIRLDDVALSNVFVHVQQSSRKLEGRLGPVALTGAFDSAGRRGQLAMAVDDGDLQWNGRARRLQHLGLNLSYQGGDARPWQVAIKTPASSVSARGRVEWGGADPEIDALVETDLDLAEIQSWMAADLELQGRSTAHIQLKGQLWDPWIALDFNLVKAVVQGIDIQGLSAKAVMDQRRIALDNVTGLGPWGRIQATGDLDFQAVFAKSLFQKTAGMENLTYAVTLTLENLQPWRIADLPLAWIGTWQGEAHLQGQGLPGLANHRGQGRTDLHVNQIRLSPGGAPVDGAIIATGHWDQALMEIMDCRATIPAHVLEARGRIDWDRFEFDAKGQLTSDDIDAFGRALGIGLPQGHAVVKLTAKGPLTRPTATADMFARDVAMKDFRFGRLLVSATLDSQLNLAFPRLVLENQGSYLEGRGHMALGQKDPAVGLELEFDQLDPADFRASTPLQAFLNGRLNVTGTIKNPQGQLTLDASPIGWKNFSATAHGQADWQQGRLGVTGLQIDLNGSEGSTVEIQGRLDFTDPQSGQWQTDPRVDLKAHAESVLLESIWPDRRGSISAKAALQGPLSNPVGEFALDAQQLDLMVQKFTQVLLTGRIRDRVFYFDDISLGLASDQIIQGKGFYALDQTFDLQLQGRDLALDLIDAIQGTYPVHGNLALDLQGSGSVQNPIISADVAVRDPLLNSQSFDDFQLQATLQDSQLRIDGKMNFDFMAEYDVTSGDFSMNAGFHETDLSPWLNLAGDTRWQTVLSGTASASGNRRAWRAMNIDVKLGYAELSFDGRRLVAIPETSLALKGGRVNLPETRLVIMEQGYLTLMATGDVIENLTLKADGSLPVTVLAPLFKKSEDISGQVILKADARGPWDHLQWQIDADLDQVGYIIPYLAQSVQDVNGRVRMTPDQIALSGISGRIDEGRFTIDGQVQLKDLQPIQGAATLNLDNLPLQVPDTMDVTVNGVLALKGAPDQALLEGNLTLLEGLYYKDLRLDLWSIVSQTKRPQTAPRVTQRPQWLRHIALDVGLSHRYPFLVDNNVAYLEIVPDLKLTGTAFRPILNGRATVTEGEVTFRGKAFPVTRGVVDFINPNKIEPSLDILSETQIRQWMVSLSITGPPDQLVVALDSSPPETENDILSLILFGRTNSELTTGPGGGGATTRQLLAGLLAGAIGQDFKKTTGVDILEVDTGAQAAEDSADRIQVTVGKKLTPRITIKYIVESNNGEMIQQAVSEYRFIEHLLASGFQDSKGRYGGELLFRLEF